MQVLSLLYKFLRDELSLEILVFIIVYLLLIKVYILILCFLYFILMLLFDWYLDNLRLHIIYSIIISFNLNFMLHLILFEIILSFRNLNWSFIVFSKYLSYNMFWVIANNCLPIFTILVDIDMRKWSRSNSRTKIHITLICTVHIVK